MKDKMGRETEMCVQVMKDRFAIDIPRYDNFFLEKTFKGRMFVTLCKSVDNYLLYLINFPDESTCLVNQLSNSYSGFFRNPLNFSMLEQAITPKKSEIERMKMPMSSLGTKYRPIKN